MKLKLELNVSLAGEVPELCNTSDLEEPRTEQLSSSRLKAKRLV